jgi:hypothetical protein
MAETSAVPGAEDIREDDQEISLDFAALTKYGAVSAALAYATGMLTINIYLHELGITDFSFAKPKLILTGVLVLMTFLLLALLPVFIAIRMAEDVRPVRTHSRKMLFWLLLPLAALFGASAALCFGKTIGLGQVAVWGLWELLGTRNVANESLASLIVAAEVYVPICVAAVSAYAATLFFKRAKLTPQTHQSAPARIYYPIVVSLAVVAVVGYIYAFSLTFYAAIPPAFGGGKPYFENFLITNDGRCPLLQLGIPFAENEPNVTQPLPVLHESDTLIAVWLDEKLVIPASSSRTGKEQVRWNPIVVQLDKTLVSAIMAERRATGTPRLTSPPIPCTASSTAGVTQTQGVM